VKQKRDYESKSTEATNMNPMQVPNEWQGNYQQPGTENPKPHPEVGVRPHTVGNILEQQTENERDKATLRKQTP
jgi:hypothetical protein